MAAGGSAAKSLQEEVTCPLCQDIYDSEKIPKKLSCDHIFCCQCLQKLIFRSIDGKQTCPVCRATNPLQESDASQYPTAHQVNRLIDIYQKTLEEQAEKSPVATEPTEPPTCSLHSSQPLALYCETCQKTVCRDCALFLCAPKKHDYDFLEEVAKKCKTKLDDKMKPLLKLREQITATVVAIEVNNAKLEEQKKEVVENIVATFKMMSHKIEEQSKKAILEAENSYEIQVNHNTLKIRELEEALESLTTALQTAEDIDIKKSLATNKSSLSEQEQNLEALKFQFKELLSPPKSRTEPSVRLEYLPLEFDPKSHLYYVGKGFKCCLTEYNLLKNFKLQQPFQIDFNLTELKNEAKIKSKLICIEDKSSISVNITKIPPNSIRLSATPQTRGKHELQLFLDDTHICGSPIQAFVSFEPHNQLSLKKIKSFTFRGATGIKCKNSHVIVSLHNITLAVFKYEKMCLTLIKEIPFYGGIKEFDIHNTLLYYADAFRHQLFKADMNGRIVASTGSRGSQPGQFNFPNGVRIRNNKVYVCDSHNGRIQVFDTDLILLNTIGKEGCSPGQFNNPYNLVFDDDGNMYVVEKGNKRVQVLSPQGKHIRFIGKSNVTDPVSPAIYNGHLFITDMTRNQIFVYTLTGTFVTSFRGEKNTECIDIDENGFIFVTNDRKSISIY